MKGGDSRVPSTRSRGEEGGFSLGNYKKHTIGERVTSWLKIFELYVWIIAFGCMIVGSIVWTLSLEKGDSFD